MLIVKNLHVAYGQSEALHGIDLSAKKNETRRPVLPSCPITPRVRVN